VPELDLPLHLFQGLDLAFLQFLIANLKIVNFFK
jgi:hypothetical protein